MLGHGLFRQLRTYAVPALSVMLLSACQNPISDDTALVESDVTNEGHPPPVASVQLANGNVVEFYDLIVGALVVESGAAYSEPRVRKSHGGRADGLEAVWRTIAPDRPVPGALTELQRRLTDPTKRRTEGPPRMRAKLGDSGGVQIEADNEARIPADPDLLAAPNGCDNGCCDYEWLATFAQCQQNGDFNWFLYNYGSSYANATDVIAYNGVACSAEGTSTYSVNIGGYGGVWSVLHAHFKAFDWLAGWEWFGGWDEKNMNTSVNSPSALHLHTYCGYIVYE